MDIKKIFFFLFFFSIFLIAEDNTINIGIAPHSSTRVILETNQDLRVFFEKYFQRPVQIVTAKNFSEFALRTNQGDFYDLVITSPNLAVLAEKSAQYTPMMTYTKGLTSVILAKDKDILKSKNYPYKIVGLDPVSFATLVAEDWLENQGLHEGKELIYTYSSASDSAANILLNNQADMSIVSMPNYLKLPDEMKNLVTIIYESSPKPSRVYLAKSKNGISLEEWKKAIEAFSKSPEGKNHIENNKLEAFKMIDSSEFKNIENIVNKTSKRLNNQ